MSEGKLAPTQFEHLGGVYNMRRTNIRTSMHLNRLKVLTVGDTQDLDFLRYARMFGYLLGNVEHVRGPESLPLVDIQSSDPVILEAWERFILVDTRGFEDDFWTAYFNAHPEINLPTLTPAALNELESDDTPEKKDT